MGGISCWRNGECGGRDWIKLTVLLPTMLIIVDVVDGDAGSGFVRGVKVGGGVFS